MKAAHLTTAWLVLVCAGCGANAYDGARKTISAATIAQLQASELLIKADSVAQMDIVNRAKAARDPEQGKRDLDAYRLKRAVADQVLAEAAAITATTSATVDLVEAGVKKRDQLDIALQELLNAMVRVKDALRSLGVAGLQ
jgi:hypothetical protein